VAARFGHRSWVCRRHIVLWPLASVLVPFIAGAEEKVMRVLGFFHGGPATATSFPRGAAFAKAFERGLSETGYVDGENLRIEYRASMEDLIKDQAEVIIVANGGFIGQARRATTTIPLVFLQPADPASTGLVASFNHPGGNITGARQEPHCRERLMGSGSLSKSYLPELRASLRLPSRGWQRSKPKLFLSPQIRCLWAGAVPWSVSQHVMRSPPAIPGASSSMSGG